MEEEMDAGEIGWENETVDVMSHGQVNMEKTQPLEVQF